VSAKGAKIEAPQAPRGVGAGGGVPLPLGEGSGEGALNFKNKNDVFGALWSMDFILNVPAREGS